MDGGVCVWGFAGLADVPDGDVDGFVELGGGNFGGINAFLESEQTFGELSNEGCSRQRRDGVARVNELLVFSLHERASWEGSKQLGFFLAAAGRS